MLSSLIVQPAQLVRTIFKGATWKEQTPHNEVFVTFDDGPIPEVTPWVLDEADRWNAKLTFFCVGENAKKHPDVLQEVLRRGHKVGNHTFNHIKAWSYKRHFYFDNIKKASQYLDTNLFRPPHGLIYPWYINPIKKNLHFDKVVLWDILTCDYDNRLSGDEVFNHVKQYLRPGSIIVFHDSLKAKKNMQYAFPKTLELIHQRNFKTSIIK